MFGGEDSKYREWMSKLTSFIVVKWASGLPWLAWATKSNEAIHDTEIALEYAQEAGDVKALSSELQNLLFDRTSGTVWDIANGGGEGNGMESYRQTKRRYHPPTVGTKPAVLNQLICIRSAGRMDGVEQKVRDMEELIKRYVSISGSSLPEELKDTVLIGLCSKEVRQIMELKNKDLGCKSARERKFSTSQRESERHHTARSVPWRWTS